MSLLRSKVSKIVAVGKNYASHAKEMGAKSLSTVPTLFLKPPSSLIEPPGPILIPSNVEAHYEVELGLVVGAEGSNVPERNALKLLRGVVCAIDITARNLQTKAKQEGNPWTVSKGFDTFCPVSQVVPIEQVGDPNDVELHLRVNGEEKQRDTTRNMIFSVEKTISYISTIMTLVPGDLILTGTPAGVGPINPGDIVRAGLNNLIEVEFKCERRI
eukprot:Plantae.Rhodophyta-Purpureofilum_apyrenoidigerum.ctg21057.p2 GENE.Plantae.Rhodophyta-Purpureofilum_apyrenoidigerum.ctg21057~~Plantae.Rhodophyta-Purpureofilum_apyrenoidigerum.ctg21057.p2  ORF type:complete len:215 (+),score=38.74 Plantae.Rhodophyta-Purpureofilum_apyrenoidigerum.ctg21057:233-877(+)